MILAGSNCADLLTFSVYKACDSARGNHQFTLSNSTTRLLHNDLLRCCYSRTLLLVCSCPATGYSCQWQWRWRLVSHVFDVHDDHEPIYDDLPTVHHTLSDYHTVFVDHPLSNHHPVFADHLHVSVNHDSLFIVDEDILFTDHHPVHHHHPLCVVHHTVFYDHTICIVHHTVFNDYPLRVVHHSIFIDYPLCEARLHMLPDLHTLLVLDPVPVRARQR